MKKKKKMFVLSTLDCTGSFANSIPQAVADAGVRRPWVKSRSHHEHQNVTALPVQPDRQKTVDPCEIDVIPNTPERKRPRQSTREYRGIKLNYYYYYYRY